MYLKLNAYLLFWWMGPNLKGSLNAYVYVYDGNYDFFMNTWLNNENPLSTRDAWLYIFPSLFFFFLSSCVSFLT